jgi:hypothetical protein
MLRGNGSDGEKVPPGTESQGFLTDRRRRAHPHGEERRAAARLEPWSPGPSFETPRKRAAPQDEGKAFWPPAVRAPQNRI